MSSDMQQVGEIIWAGLTLTLAGWLIARRSFAARPRLEYIKIQRPVRSRRANGTRR